MQPQIGQADSHSVRYGLQIRPAVSWQLTQAETPTPELPVVVEELPWLPLDELAPLPVELREPEVRVLLDRECRAGVPQPVEAATGIAAQTAARNFRRNELTPGAQFDQHPQAEEYTLSAPVASPLVRSPPTT
jgi:hypothetical protein